MLTIDPAQLRLSPGAAVIDVGCGAGRHTHAVYYAAAVTVWAVDHSFEDVRAVRRGFEQHPDVGPDRGARFALAAGDALRLPFPDDAFDAAICAEVLEHIPDCDAAIGELARIVKPGGRLAVSVPRAWPERLCWRLAPEYAAERGGHVRIFRRSNLEARLRKGGFVVTKRAHAHGLHAPYWWLRCMLWTRQDVSKTVRAYRRFLEWDILKRPLLTRALERLLAPLMGKSLVLYLERAPT